MFGSVPKAWFVHPGSPLYGPGARPLPPNHTYLECNEVTLPIWWRMKDLTGVTDANVSPLYFCGLLKRHNKVALTGKYADEIFSTMM